METNKAEPLDGAVAELDRLIVLTHNCGLTGSAQFLAMAKAQLLIELERSRTRNSALCATCSTASSRRNTATRPLRAPGATAGCARCAAPGSVRRMRPPDVAAAARLRGAHVKTYAARRISSASAR